MKANKHKLAFFLKKAALMVLFHFLFYAPITKILAQDYTFSGAVKDSIIHGTGIPGQGIEGVSILNTADQELYQSLQLGMYSFSSKHSNPKLLFAKQDYIPRLLNAEFVNSSYYLPLLHRSEYIVLNPDMSNGQYRNLVINVSVLIESGNKALANDCVILIPDYPNECKTNSSNICSISFRQVEIDRIAKAGCITLIAYKKDYFYKETTHCFKAGDLDTSKTSSQLKIGIEFLVDIEKDLFEPHRSFYAEFNKEIEKLGKKIDELNKLSQSYSSLTDSQKNRIKQLENSIEEYKNSQYHSDSLLQEWIIQMENEIASINESFESRDNFEANDNIEAIPTNIIPNDPRKANRIIITPPYCFINLNNENRTNGLFMIGFEKDLSFYSKKKSKYVSFSPSISVKTYFQVSSNKNMVPELQVGIIPGKVILQSNFELQVECAYGKGYIDYSQSPIRTDLIITNFTVKKSFPLSKQVSSDVFTQITNKIPINYEKNQKPIFLWGVLGFGISF